MLEPVSLTSLAAGSHYFGMLFRYPRALHLDPTPDLTPRGCINSKRRAECNGNFQNGEAMFVRALVTMQ